MQNKINDVFQEILELHKKWILGKEGGKRAILAGKYLSDCFIPIDTDLTGADLRNTMFWRFNKYGRIILRESNLEGAWLIGAYLIGADLKGANLTNAHLKDVFLENANLAEANLKGASLVRTGLTNADLRGADLRKADLGFYSDYYGNGLWGVDRPDLTNANLEGAILKNAIPVGANFSGVPMPDGKIYDPAIHTIEMLTA